MPLREQKNGRRKEEKEREKERKREKKEIQLRVGESARPSPVGEGGGCNYEPLHLLYISTSVTGWRQIIRLRYCLLTHARISPPPSEVLLRLPDDRSIVPVRLFFSCAHGLVAKRGRVLRAARATKSEMRYISTRLAGGSRALISATPPLLFATGFLLFYETMTAREISESGAIRPC